MITSKYDWDKDIYLVHVDVVNHASDKQCIGYGRGIGVGTHTEIVKEWLKSGESRRFIVSKKSRDEQFIFFEYDSGVSLQVFKLLDRAYLPTEADRCQVNIL